MRIDITITPMDALWRVYATVNGQRAPEHLRQYPTHADAIAYAETLANVLAVRRFSVTLHDAEIGKA